MELSQKTTILFPEFLYNRLRHLAKAKHTSIGDLVRKACAREYGVASKKEVLKAVDDLAALSSPISDVKTMISTSSRI